MSMNFSLWDVALTLNVLIFPFPAPPVYVIFSIPLFMPSHLCYNHFSYPTSFQAILNGFLSEFSQAVKDCAGQIVHAAVEIYNRLSVDLLPTPGSPTMFLISGTSPSVFKVSIPLVFGCFFIHWQSSPCIWLFSEELFSWFVKWLNTDLWTIQAGKTPLTRELNQHKSTHNKLHKEPISDCIFGHFVTSTLLQKLIICWHLLNLWEMPKITQLDHHKILLLQWQGESQIINRIWPISGWCALK